MITRILEHLGMFFLMLKKTFSRPENNRVYWREFMDQCYTIGIGSLPIILIISVFLGMVMTIQTAYQMISPVIPKYIISMIVRDSSVLELSPTINAIVLAGVVGSRIASELGNMRVSEQIDALEIMGINTRTYLILPKILASMLLVPCLIVLSIGVSIAGGYFAGTLTGILTESQYIAGLHSNFRGFTLFVSIVKAIVFAFTISSASSYFGYNVKGGALEIGKASTTAVIISCIAVLLCDYLITSLLL